MTFKMRSGPLPDNHPFKGGRIIFGMKKPVPPSVKPAEIDKPQPGEPDKPTSENRKP